MKKISSIVSLLFLILLLFVGCVKSPSVLVKDEPNVKPSIVEPPSVPPPTSEPTITKQPMVTPRKPDSNVWGYLGKTKSGDTYYNKTNIIKSSNIISVWIYKIVTDDFRKQTIEEVKKNDLEKSIKYQNYEHYVRLDEIDCQKNLYRLKESIDYDDNGNVLNSSTYTNEEWKNIQVLTGLDKLREKLCVAQKKPLEKKK